MTMRKRTFFYFECAVTEINTSKNGIHIDFEMKTSHCKHDRQLEKHFRPSVFIMSRKQYDFDVN